MLRRRHINGDPKGRSAALPALALPTSSAGPSSAPPGRSSEACSGRCSERLRRLEPGRAQRRRRGAGRDRRGRGRRPESSWLPAAAMRRASRSRRRPGWRSPPPSRSRRPSRPQGPALQGARPSFGVGKGVGVSKAPSGERERDELPKPPAIEAGSERQRIAAGRRRRGNDLEREAGAGRPGGDEGRPSLLRGLRLL